MRRILILLLVGIGLSATPARSTEYDNALTLTWARTTLNNWEEVFLPNEIDFARSWLVGVAYSRRLGGLGDTLSFEAEGQLNKHYSLLRHWEVNALAGARWEKFWWDDVVDTSAAFGLGLSYATSLPSVEVATDGSSRRLLVGWMLELAFSLPDAEHVALVTRLQHRSGAYGLVANRGGSNAIGVGLKFRY